MGQSIQVLPEEVPLYLKYVLLGLDRLLHTLGQFEAKVVQKPDALFVQTSPLLNFNCASNQFWKLQVFGEDIVFPTPLTNLFVWILQAVLVVPALATFTFYLLLLLYGTARAPEERSIRVVGITHQIICTLSYIFRAEGGKKARVSLLARQKGQQTPLIFIQHPRSCDSPIAITFGDSRVVDHTSQVDVNLAALDAALDGLRPVGFAVRALLLLVHVLGT